MTIAFEIFNVDVFLASYLCESGTKTAEGISEDVSKPYRKK